MTTACDYFAAAQRRRRRQTGAIKTGGAQTSPRRLPNCDGQHTELPPTTVGPAAAARQDQPRGTPLSCGRQDDDATTAAAAAEDARSDRLLVFYSLCWWPRPLNWNQRTGPVERRRRRGRC